MRAADRLVGERYELLGPLASGGMGRVWRARDTLLGRPVAVKILRSELSDDPTFRARFRAEAQHAGVLHHPHIASVFDYGESEAGGERLAYLVMELVDGQPLSAVLAREGALDAERTVHILRQTAAALAAAHAAGVVHRDVKPGNVLLSRDGTVKITDFGIAVSTASAPLTRTGQVIGTAHYLAPEQSAGGKATPASDVYALGAVAYECLTGRRPFDGESAVQIALKQMREQPEPLPTTVPAPLRRQVERAMAKNPAERFADGAALLAALDELTATRPLTAAGPTGTAVMPAPAYPHRPTPAPAQRSGVVSTPARASSRRLPWPLLAGAAAALLLIAVVAALAGGGSAAPQAEAPSSSSAQPKAPSPPSAPATAREATVAVDGLVNRPVTEVQAELVARGLKVTLAPVSSGTVPAGQVTAVTPSRSVPVGSAVTVSYAVAPVVTQAPQPAPAPDAKSPDAKNKGKGGRKGGGND